LRLDISGVNWLEKLDLPIDKVVTLELGRLRSAEIGSLLRAAGEATTRIAQDRALLQLVVDKSEGDPFYLHFLLEDLLREPEDAVRRLRDRPPALDGYLSDWWSDVSAAAAEESLSDLLGYLLVAKGPLSRDELVEISDTDALRGATFERTIELVKRYLLQDDKGGFEFCHPRFRDYIAETRVRSREQRIYGTRLFEYCAPWKEQPSRYAFAHYAEHLRDSGRLADLYGLISKPWMEAKFQQYHAHRSFSVDVRLALKTAADESPPNMYEMARLSVIGATLASLASMVPPEVIRVLAVNGECDRALGYASLNPEPEQRIRGLLCVAEAEWARHDGRAAERECRSAVRELFLSDDFEGGYELLGQALHLLHQVAGPEGLLELAESDGHRDVIVSNLIGILVQQGGLARALTLAESLKDNWTKQKCLTDLARAWLDKRDVKQALDAADAAPEIWRVSGSDYSLMPHLERTLVELADSNLFQAAALRLAPEDRNGLLLRVMLGAVKAGKLDFAYEVAALPGTEEWRGTALFALAGSLAEVGRFDEALQVARSAEGPLRVRAVAIVAAAGKDKPVPPSATSEARVAAADLDSIAQNDERTEAACWLVCAFSPDDPQAADLAKRAFEFASQVASGRKDFILERAGEALVHAREWDLARQILAAIPDGFNRSESVRSQALSLVHSGEHERALALVNMLTDVHNRLKFALSIGPPLVEAGQFQAAVALATGLEGDYYREEALKPIVDALMAKKEYRLAVEALRAVKPYYRREILKKILPALVEAGKLQLAADAASSDEVGLTGEFLKHLTWLAVRTGGENRLLGTPELSDYYKAQIELEICRALLAQGDVNRAAERAKASPTEARRKALSETAVAFARQNRLSDARELAGLIDLDYARNDALGQIIEEDSRVLCSGY
jgi:hypothetical protein